MEPDNINEQKFRPYPTDSVISHFANADDAQAALDALRAIGYRDEDFDILSGPEGAVALDRTGEHHGAMARLWRFLQHLSNSEQPIMKIYEDALNAGHTAFAVQVEAEQEKVDEVREILKRHNGEHIAFYGKGLIRKLER